MSKSGDPRMGDLLKKCLEASSEAPHLRKVALLGYPCDQGVKRNNGRVGAKFGPSCVRKILPKLGPLRNPEFDVDLNNIHLKDHGNVEIGDDLEENHVS